MLKHLRVSLIFISAVFATGCGGGAANSGANTNTAVQADQANTSPNLPANNANLPNGTPTPGIPSPDQIRKGVKAGATPTPGIPSDATLRKQMGIPQTNVNMPISKSKRKLGGRIQ